MSASYRERETFISRVARDRDPLSLYVARDLFRVAATLQRLSEAQCNGDYPADNGERKTAECPECGTFWAPESLKGRGRCPHKCRPDMNHVRTYAAPDPPGGWVPCDCDNGYQRPICPDCRAQHRTYKILEGSPWRPVFGGDPRGYVLKIARRSTPGEDIENGRAESRGDVIGVPS